jgi:Zn-dependent protease
MRSLKLLTVGGIDIELHWSFFLFIILYAIFAWEFVPVLITLFIIISLHELTHSMVAKRHGIGVQKIVLLPIGGMAVMKEVRMEPHTEFKMAISGPLFNFAFCALILLGVSLTGTHGMMYGFNEWSDSLGMETAEISLASIYLSSLFWLNYVLGAFNLFVPAIPLDGGRVFRSVLAMLMSYVTATKIATKISTVATILMFIFGFLSGNILLLVIAVFIYLGASSEMEFALSEQLLSKIKVGQLLRHEYLIVGREESLNNVLRDMIMSRSLVMFTHSPSGKTLMMASLGKVKDKPRKEWTKLKVKDIAQKVKAIRMEDTVNNALKSMAAHETDVLPVVDRNGQLQGIIHRDDIDHVFKVLKVMGG